MLTQAELEERSDVSVDLTLRACLRLRNDEEIMKPALQHLGRWVQIKHWILSHRVPRSYQLQGAIAEIAAEEIIRLRKRIAEFER